MINFERYKPASQCTS